MDGICCSNVDLCSYKINDRSIFFFINNLTQGDQDDVASMLPMLKRRKGCQQHPEQDKDEQAVSESSLNRLVGGADMCNLKVYDF